MSTRHRLGAAACLLAVFVLPARGADAKKTQPWERPYAGAEATGEHVIALWNFDKGAGLTDATGEKKHTLKLRGKSRVVNGGRFGRCLECFAAVGDKPEGAQVPRMRPEFSPTGAFTVEMWVKPKPDLAKTRQAFLIDSKYFHYKKALPQANTGFVFILQKSREQWRPTVMLGFGTDTEIYSAKPVDIAIGQWRHMAFTYDGAGTVRMLVDGRDVGGATYKGRGPITRAKYPLTVGARVGSMHHGFPGFIDEVRLTNGVALGGLSVDVGTRNGRTVFHRMEKDIRIGVSVRNNTDKVFTNVVANVSFAEAKQIRVPRLAPKQAHTVELALDTALRPDTYELRVVAAARAGGRTYDVEQSTPIVIVPRPLPHVMPVVMWGHGDFKNLKEIGFTHHLGSLADHRGILETGKPVPVEKYRALSNRRENLNQHLAEGVGMVASLAPGRTLIRMKKFLRVDRAGKTYPTEDVCARAPEARKFCYLVGASVAQAFGEFPALQGALIHSEVRGHTNTCFHKYDLEAYRKYAGQPVPKSVTSKAYKRYPSIKGFPADRIVPDDDPILKFYRWFWREGDGWNDLHTQVSKGLKSTGRNDLWTFYDPAVRVPPVWGSGGEVDYLSQWTYTYPDPLKIGQATDELFAMADGRPGQQVMKMTQVIWYRKGTAPKLPKLKSQYAPWEKEIPDARFVTIAPDHLEIALWSMIARPIKGIMYHGWGSLVAGITHGSYRHTNPVTRRRLAGLVRSVVRPLGPTLLQVDDRQADVALLESFTSQLYATRGPWGWSNGWEADMHLILQWAQVQPRVVYEETILRDGLDKYKVLVLPGCAVLPRGVAEKIDAFQRAGGIVVADEQLAPGLNPDILVESYRRTAKAREDKAALQARAVALRRELDTVYTRYGESNNPDVAVRFRQYGGADYLFAINDKRTFGTYLGHHGLVMEKGLPNAAVIRVRRPKGFVYDLLAHKPVGVARAEGGMRFQARFGPGQGRLFLIAPTEIADVTIEAPGTAKRGRSVTVNVAVVDSADQPVKAVMPVRVEVLDPKGRPAERTGCYGAKDGKLSVTVDLAPNDLTGAWTVRVTDLAGGAQREHSLTIE